MPGQEGSALKMDYSNYCQGGTAINCRRYLQVQHLGLSLNPVLSPSCDLLPWGTLCIVLLLSKVLSTFLYLDTELFRTVKNTFYQKTICGDLLYYQKPYYNIIIPQCRQTIASEPLSLFLTPQSQLVF